MTQYEDEDDFDATVSNGRFDALRERGREVFGGVAERGKERLLDAAERGRDRVAERLTSGAEYLRTNDVDVIREDLIAEIRAHPLRSTAIAVGAGYLLGRIIAPPLPRFGRAKRGGMGDQIGRAVVGAVATMIAARVQASLLGEPDIEEVIPPKPRAPRKRAAKRTTE
jgi:hypothetical protein